MTRPSTPPAALALATLLALTVSACGGGGGAAAPAPTPAPPPPPPATSFTLSGTLSIAPTAAVDSDSNDVNQQAQGGYRRNDDTTQAQTLTTPVLLAGTVNEAGSGPAGNNKTAGDLDDVYSVELVAGQVVELEFATDAAQSDIDLYLVSDDGAHVGASEGADTRYECVRASTSGRYFVDVAAFRNASIYNLRIGAPGSASACAVSTSAAPVVAGQLLAKPRRIDAGTARQAMATLQAAGVTGVKLDAAPPAVPQLLQLNASKKSVLRAGQNNPRIELLKTAKRLQASGAFAYVQPNWIAERSALVGSFPPDDRAYEYQRWHYEQINLPAAMGRITGLTAQPAQRPLVAVIDDGVVLDHPDLAPQLFSPGRAFISRSSAGDGNTASGDNTAVAADQPVFHGSHVAGTVAAATFDGIGGAGTAPMAQILPLRVFPPAGGATSVDIVNAMLYAARLPNNSGTLPARRADVINMSLGGDRACDAAYQDVIDQVRAAGVIVVVAAGNSGHNDRGQRAAVGAPANCNGAIAVSALNARKGITPYSNTGTQIAVAAPGGDASQSTTGSGAPDNVYSDVASFDANGVRQPAFGGMQGTSMAAPHVAGVMALMRYVNPALTVAQVDALLAQGALTDELGAAGRDIDFGFGLINALKAVNAALAAGTNPPPVPQGQIVAGPSSIDFGSFQSSAVLDLSATAATSETVVGIGSDNLAVTVAATAVDGSTGLGRYTVNVNRALLAPGSVFPTLTVTLAPARTLTVQLTITQPAAGGAMSNADYGPLYVLLIDPDTQQVVDAVLATRSNGQYSWSASGYSKPRLALVAGADLDNDDFVCQRGEPCGAYPVLAPGRDLTVLTLTGDRNDLNFQVAPLSGMSVQRAVGEAAPWRRSVSGAAAAEHADQPAQRAGRSAAR